MAVYEVLRDEIAAERPVALATVVDGPGVGAKLRIYRVHNAPGKEISSAEEAGALPHPAKPSVAAKAAAATRRSRARERGRLCA